MHRPRTKRQQLIRSTVVYSVMTTLVLVGLSLAIFYLLGYRFNADSRTINQGGLLQVETRPNGARITLDGGSASATTPERLTVGAGSHSVRLTREGYRPWQKTITVEPSGVHWLNYGLLIPETPTETEVARYATVDEVLPAPGKNAVLITNDRTKPEFRLIDLDDEAADTLVRLPSDIAPTVDGQYKLLAWAADQRHVLVQHRAGSDYRWYMFDTRTPADSTDITAIVGDNLSLREVRIANDAGSIVYGMQGSTLRRINLADRTVSAPIARNVDQYWLSNAGTVTYVTKYESNRASQDVGYYTPGAQTSRVLQTVYTNNDTELRAMIGTYQNDSYLAVQNDDTITLHQLNLQDSDDDGELNLRNVAIINTDGVAEYVSFSPHERFIVAQYEDTYATYDVELGRYATTTVKGEDPIKQQFEWLDRYHVWSARDGELRLYEFDGGNRQTLGQAVDGLAPKLTSDSRELYVFRSVDDAVALIRIDLRI